MRSLCAMAAAMIVLAACAGNEGGKTRAAKGGVKTAPVQVAGNDGTHPAPVRVAGQAGVKPEPARAEDLERAGEGTHGLQLAGAEGSHPVQVAANGGVKNGPVRADAVQVAGNDGTHPAQLSGGEGVKPRTGEGTHGAPIEPLPLAGTDGSHPVQIAGNDGTHPAPIRRAAETGIKPAAAQLARTGEGTHGTPFETLQLAGTDGSHPVQIAGNDGTHPASIRRAAETGIKPAVAQLACTGEGTPGAPFETLQLAGTDGSHPVQVAGNDGTHPAPTHRAAETGIKPAVAQLARTGEGTHGAPFETLRLAGNDGTHPAPTLAEALLLARRPRYALACLPPSCTR